MEPTEKKISFAFSKISKRPTLLNKPEEKKVELIDCLEGQNIKVRDAIQIEEKPLIISLKENKKNLSDRIKEFHEKSRPANKNELEDTRPDSELTIDELAARELLRDAKNRISNNESSKNTFTVPLTKDQDSLLTEGEAEPTLEDYEKIPISDYGLAMLRGMGWNEGTGIGKNPSKTAPVMAPELRPKGLGLGATKMIKEKLSKETSCDKDGKTLVLKKGALAKIIAGSHKGQYCEVQGLDEESARVIVKTALKGDVLTLNELFVLLVTKEEYGKNAKVLNSLKYEEYKEKEKKISDLKSERNSSSDSDDNIGKKERGSNSKGMAGNHSRKTGSDSDSSYESQSEKCSKPHKRKDKRRHRDRSRSPPSYRYRNGKKSKNRHRSSSSDSEYEKRRRERRRNSKERKEKKNKR